MKPDRKTTVALVVLFVILISLSACQTMGRYQQDSYKEIDYNEGTEGVEAVFLRQTPPQSLFEGADFDVQAQLHNKGSFDLSENRYSMTMSLKYDTSSVQMREQEQNTRYG
ncbi:MAG: hypothetical protein ACOCZV_01320, partial [Nanoarchaeota archaeon]